MKYTLFTWYQLKLYLYLKIRYIFVGVWVFFFLGLSITPPSTCRQKSAIQNTDIIFILKLVVANITNRSEHRLPYFRSKL